MERRPLFAILVLATVLLAAAPAAALPDGDGPAALSAKLRLALPYGGGEALNGSEGVATLLGGSATMELYELVGVELGGTWLRTDGERGSYDLYARVGAVPVLWDGRGAAGGGWTVQAGALWGWRYRHREVDLGAGDAAEDAHAFTATASLEGTYWWESGVGLNLRGVFTFGVPLARTVDQPDGEDAFDRPADWFLGGGLMLGLAF